MVKQRTAFIFGLLFITAQFSFGQDDGSDLPQYAGGDSSLSYENSSLGFYYPENFKVSISPAYSLKDNLKLPSYSRLFFINVNYSISNFYFPLDYSSSQVGFYNEIGMNNFSLYLNLGQELRLKKHFYLIPYLGVAVIPFSKYENDDMAVIYYLGAAAGYIFNLTAETDIIFEAATDFIKFKKDQNNFSFKIGLSYNLLYPL